jgi:D-alanyl-D-alanine carboxypeptidase
MLAGCRKAAINDTAGTTNTVPWADSSLRHAKNADYRALIEKYRKLGFPGISLLVTDRYGTWVGSSGKADVANNIPFGVGQVSKAASITKLILSTTIFRMIDDSANTKLGYNFLNDPVSKWVPASVLSKVPNGNLVTLGDCLKHETGIPDLIDQPPFYLAVLNYPTKSWTPEELLEYVYGLDADFKPREKAVYSNTNFVLVAMVVEAATGKKHADLIKKYVTGPLGMGNTFYQPHDRLPSTTAQGYYDLYNNGTIANVSNLITGSGNGYGGMFSNVFDLKVFIEALLIKKTLLTQKSLNVMQTFGPLEELNRYGYGIQMKYTDRGADYGIGHSGRDVGYSANLFHFPNRNLLQVFFINYGTDGDSDLRNVFKQFEQELIDVMLK